MSLLPDINERGELIEQPTPKLYTPPTYSRRNAELEESNLAELNNLNRPQVAEDFSDSPHL